MARVRQTGTQPELVVRKVITKLGQYYRLKNRDLPGSPDLANRSKRWAVFVHGCFWHRHPDCAKTTTPKRNREFWKDKFEANLARDKSVARELTELGYRVLVVWECETEQSDELEAKLRDWFSKGW